LFLYILIFLSQLSTCLQQITLLISTILPLNHIIIMYKQLYIISYTYIFLPWKCGTCLIICLHLSPRWCLQAPHTFIKITHFMFWQLGMFFIILPKKCFLYIMETTDRALSYTENNNQIVYKMKAYGWVELVQQHDTSWKPFNKLKWNLILGVYGLT